MVEFAGWDMPLQYRGIREEHLAVRQAVGVFDVSHMGEVLVTGPKAEDFLQRLVTNDVSRLGPGQGLYSVMCTDAGGIVDDVVVLRRPDESGFLVVVNAATREKDVDWMHAHLGDGAAVEDVSDEIALLAVQGPRAVEVVGILAEGAAPPVATIRRFHCARVGLRGAVGSSWSLVSRTGYTGEDGFELFVDATSGAALFDAVLEVGGPCGLLPCGLGARDTLRLEAGLRLYGQDIDESVDPFSAGLGWTVHLDKGDFIGAAALRRLAEAPPQETIGLRLRSRAIARHGHGVLDPAGRRIGEVTSGTFGFSVGAPIALARVARGSTAGATEVLVDVRGQRVEADVVPLPFYRRQGSTLGSTHRT